VKKNAPEDLVLHNNSTNFTENNEELENEPNNLGELEFGEGLSDDFDVGMFLENPGEPEFDVGQFLADPAEFKEPPF
jgi:hypothetical protein